MTNPLIDRFEIPLITNPEVENYLAGAANRLVGLGDDVWNSARDIIINGVQQGQGVRDVRDLINDQVGIESGRAGVIARTEMNRAMNAGSLEQMRKIDAPNMTKAWQTGGDNIRDWHGDAQGQKVGINEVFEVDGEGLDSPGDGSARNAVNCKCTMLFDVPDDQLISSAARSSGGEDATYELADHFDEEGMGAVGQQAITDDMIEAPLSPGMNARYSLSMAHKLTDQMLIYQGEVSSAEMRERLLKFNEVIARRFGAYFQHVERVRSNYGAKTMMYIRNGNILGIREEFLKDDVALRNELTGWLFKGTGKIEDVFTHEFGHVFMMGGQVPATSQGALWDNALDKALRAIENLPHPNDLHVSRYARKTVDEGEAELFAFYHMGAASRPPWVIKWGETLMTELGLDPTPLCVDLGMC